MAVFYFPANEIQALLQKKHALSVHPDLLDLHLSFADKQASRVENGGNRMPSSIKGFIWSNRKSSYDCYLQPDLVL